MDADAQRAFMRHAVRALGGAHAGRSRRAIRRGHRQGRQGHRRGLEPRHLDERPDRACRGHAPSATPAKALGTFSLAGCEIYTSCEPCPMCLAAIYWARLDRIYFANSREDAAAIGFDDELIYDEVVEADRGARHPDASKLDAAGSGGGVRGVAGEARQGRVPERSHDRRHPRMAERAAALGACHGRHRLDRHLVLLHLARGERCGSGAGQEPGIAGETWMVHGGGFYLAEKYAVAPERMPDELHWFKYEAYFTWLTGFLLLVVDLLFRRRRVPDRQGQDAARSGLGGHPLGRLARRRLVHLRRDLQVAARAEDGAARRSRSSSRSPPSRSSITASFPTAPRSCMSAR